MKMLLAVVLGAVINGAINYFIGVDLRDHYALWQVAIHDIGLLFWGVIFNESLSKS